MEDKKPKTEARPVEFRVEIPKSGAEAAAAAKAMSEATQGQFTEDEAARYLALIASHGHGLALIKATCKPTGKEVTVVCSNVSDTPVALAMKPLAIILNDETTEALLVPPEFVTSSRELRDLVREVLTDIVKERAKRHGNN